MKCIKHYIPSRFPRLVQFAELGKINTLQTLAFLVYLFVMRPLTDIREP